jgi:hypothetical protein
MKASFQGTYNPVAAMEIGSLAGLQEELTLDFWT